MCDSLAMAASTKLIGTLKSGSSGSHHMYAGVNAGVNKSVSLPEEQPPNKKYWNRENQEPALGIHHCDSTTDLSGCTPVS